MKLVKMGELEKLNYKSQLDKNSDEYKTKLKVNNDYIEELSKENTKAENIIPILDEFNNLLKETPELFGSGKWMEAKRAIAKFTGDDAPIQRANYLQKYFFLK
jgi:predicted nuclease with TOPRIM domain